jgi:hypothetical protein
MVAGDTLRNKKSLRRIPCSISSVRCSCSPLKLPATNVAPTARASVMGLTGFDIAERDTPGPRRVTVHCLPVSRNWSPATIVAIVCCLWPVPLSNPQHRNKG